MAGRGEGPKHRANVQTKRQTLTVIRTGRVKKEYVIPDGLDIIIKISGSDYSLEVEAR